MSESQIRRVFRVSSRDAVPPYQLVQVQTPARRSARSTSSGDRKAVSLKAFGKRYTLRLQRNRDFERRVAKLRMFAAETTPSGLSYTPLKTKVGTQPTVSRNRLRRAITLDRGLGIFHSVFTLREVQGYSTLNVPPTQGFSSYSTIERPSRAFQRTLVFRLPGVPRGLVPGAGPGPIAPFM